MNLFFNKEDCKMDSNDKIIPINESAVVPSETEMDVCDLFPVIKVPESSLQKYKKVPVAGLAALGTAFTKLPVAARTIVQNVTTSVATDETLFVGINPKGVPGYLLQNQYGTVGNIMQINDQGKQVIAGRMRFKPLNSLPVNETTQTVVPFDPTLMVVAVAVMAIEQKLDKIQASVEEVLKFLELEKQARQRGNLRKLAEIAEDYKVKCGDKEFCTNRNVIAQKIQVEAMQDIEFYQEKVAMELQKQKAIHMHKDTTMLLDSVTHEFAEYQLASYLYAYSSFLDVMLRRDFSTATLNSTTDKMKKMAARYDALYSECQSQLAQYQRNSIETKVVGGLGIAAKELGKAIGSIPVVKEGPVDEALISAGASLGSKNRRAVAKLVEGLSAFQDNRMTSFVDSLSSVNLIYNRENSMLTDGENIYVLQ